MSGWWVAAVAGFSAASGASGVWLAQFVRREQPHVEGCGQGRWTQQDPGQDVAESYVQAVEHVERLEAVLRDILARPYVPGISGREYEALVRDLAKNALEDKP